ncbi:hypothetical protein FS837_007465 [Tulasnella sp. UAMH 9824]|nr:hypothetical protein FS837_007465 [Tulasnella sp. UAMH 9824]
MPMPEPVQVTEPFGYDVDGYRPGGFVAPPTQQVPPKLEIPREPQFPQPKPQAQPSPQVLPVSKPEERRNRKKHREQRHGKGKLKDAIASFAEGWAFPIPLPHNGRTQISPCDTSNVM